MFVMLIMLAIFAFYVFAGWKIFEKAGKPGWAVIVPIYNILVELDIVGKPRWWLLLMFIPVVNVVISVLVFLELAKVFGKSAGFGLGLFFFGFIFFPILAFGSATYVGSGSAAPAQAAAA